MNAVVLSDDEKVAQLGPGGIFSEIYPQFVPYNLTIMGGRAPGIAVGGFVIRGEYTSRRVPAIESSYIIRWHHLLIS